MPSFSTDYVQVNYELNYFPGNCGAIIVYCCVFHIINPEIKVNDKQIEEFYKRFHTFLIDNTRNQNKIVMSDNVYAKSLPCIVNFCRYNKWHEGPHTFNSNSDNYIALFEFSKGASLRSK